MDLGLNGKRVLVTGGSKGIGFACVRLLVAEGARVAICSRSKENVASATSALPGVIGLTANLADADEAVGCLDAAEKALGPLDVLIGSAGAAARRTPEELNPQRWREAMDAKFFSYLNVMDPMVKRMAERRSGVIVNVIGTGGKQPTATHLSGGAANAALMLATIGLGLAYAAAGVRMVGINPGLTETDRVSAGLKAEARLANISEADARRAALKRMPSGRMASPEDVANMAVFLASDLARHVSGTIITVDGAYNPVM